jgi:hypothetical protein
MIRSISVAGLALFAGVVMSFAEEKAVEAPKAEAVKVEAPKVDVAKTNAAAVEAVKADAVKTVEAAKSEVK